METGGKGGDFNITQSTVKAFHTVTKGQRRDLTEQAPTMRLNRANSFVVARSREDRILAAEDSVGRAGWGTAVEEDWVATVAV